MLFDIAREKEIVQEGSHQNGKLISHKDSKVEVEVKFIRLLSVGVLQCGKVAQYGTKIVPSFYVLDEMFVGGDFSIQYSCIGEESPT